MIQVTAYPTLEWLRTRAHDRGPVFPRDHSVPSDRMSTNFINQLASRFRQVLVSETRIDVGVWISTPNGEKEVGLVIQHRDRSIAICDSRHYGQNPQCSDAVALVYGGFEALYRFGGNPTEEVLDDIVYMVMCDRAGWFTNFGRLSVGRKVSDETLLETCTRQDRSNFLIDTDEVCLTRMRLCVASDWVDPFERALDAGRRFAKRA